LTTEPQPTSPGFRLLKENRLRLLTDGAGAIEPDQRGYGLYAGDTRFICRLGLSVAGRRPRPGAGLDAATGPGQADRFELVSGRAGLRLWRDRALDGGLIEWLTLALTDPGSRTVTSRLTMGEARRPGDGPGPVPGACPVQAWAPAAPLHVVRSLLGRQPNAALGRLSLKRPGLPTTVGTMRISGLLVGSSQVDLEIRRTRRGFRIRTLGPDGPIRVTPSR
jgi:hypothetical protein